MLNFTYSIPTRIHFGKGQISHLTELKQSGSRVLLVYGGGSIKRAGIYDEAIRLLTGAGMTVSELPGVEPNPIYFHYSGRWVIEDLAVIYARECSMFSS